MKHLPLAILTTLAVLLGIVTSTPAQMSHEGSMGKPLVEQPSQFQRIDQPLWTRVIVTGAGFGLIGLELWWFVFSKPKTQGTKSGEGG